MATQYGFKGQLVDPGYIASKMSWQDDGSGNSAYLPDQGGGIEFNQAGLDKFGGDPVGANPVYSYDDSQYASPAAAYLDHLGDGKYGAPTTGLAAKAAQLGLDPQALVDAWNKTGTDQVWLSGPAGFLEQASRNYTGPNASTLKSFVANPAIGQALTQESNLSNAKWQAGHPAMQMHGGDYAAIAAGIASILSMGAAGGAFGALGAGAEGAGAGAAAGWTSGYDIGAGGALGAAAPGAVGAGSTALDYGTLYNPVAGGGFTPAGAGANFGLGGDALTAMNYGTLYVPNGSGTGFSVANGGAGANFGMSPGVSGYAIPEGGAVTQGNGAAPGSLGSMSDTPVTDAPLTDPAADTGGASELGGAPAQPSTTDQLIQGAKDLYANPVGKEVINTAGKTALQALLAPKSDGQVATPDDQAITSSPVTAGAPPSLGAGGIGVASSSLPATTAPPAGNTDPLTGAAAVNTNSVTNYDPRQRRDSVGNNPYTGALGGAP